MGLPYYSCPEKVWEAWWKLCRLAGFSISALPDVFFEGLGGEHKLENTASGGRVRYGEEAADVLLRQRLGPGSKGREYQLYVFPSSPSGRTRGSNKLAESIERILLGSGAEKIPAKRPRCQRLYRCKPSFAKRWRAHIGGRGFGAELLDSGRMDEATRSSELSVNTNGLIRRSNGVVRVFTGPAIDPSNGDYMCYIALGYDDMLLHQLRRHNRRLANEIDGILVEDGAIRIPLRPKCQES
jgi:hypothetical protein